jgi:NAD(P)H-hydrate epimerase
VDIPSGISADCGQILGIAVKANETITFEEMKLGLLLYPGAEYAGKITVVKIGILPMSQQVDSTEAYLFCEPRDIMRLLPKRPAYANKGTFGKVLVIAGSKQVTGAAFLSAYAAYRMGVGLVKILTAYEAIPVLQQLLPEAIFGAYDGDNWEQELMKSITWADSVVLGPGIGTNQNALQLFTKAIDILKSKECDTPPLVVDADALNILSASLDSENVKKTDRYSSISNKLPKRSILTPHLMELSRLSLEGVNNIPSILIDIARECTYNNELIYVLKDTRTIVSSQNRKVINISGNNAMATGGSGDALTGIIAALLARGLLREEAAMLGVYMHGLAGDASKVKLGANSVLARDIIEALPEVLMNYDGK